MKRFLILGALCPLLLFCLSGEAYAQRATLEGVLKMYVIDNTGEGREVSAYEETDRENTFLAFVVEMTPTDLGQYLDSDGLAELSDSVQTDVMVVPQFRYRGKAFADKYAGKRVRVTGILSVPGGGWRNATEVVMELQKIALAE